MNLRERLCLILRGMDAIDRKDIDWQLCANGCLALPVTAMPLFLFHVPPTRSLIFRNSALYLNRAGQVSITRLRPFAFFLFALFWLWGPRLFFFEGINTSIKSLARANLAPVDPTVKQVASRD